MWELEDCFFGSDGGGNSERALVFCLLYHVYFFLYCYRIVTRSPLYKFAAEIQRYLPYNLCAATINNESLKPLVETCGKTLLIRGLFA